MIHQTDILVDDVDIDDVIVFEYNGKTRCGMVTEKRNYALTLWDFTVEDSLGYYEQGKYVRRNGGYRSFLYNKIKDMSVTVIDFDGKPEPTEFLIVDERLSDTPKRSLWRKLVNILFPSEVR